jgi:hypothetical protein
MTKQQPTEHPAIAVSPSLSLRQAVRPLIFAHALLAREKGLSAQLAEECDKLKQLTKKALEAAALVHLLAPDKAEHADADSSRRSQFISAYAKAGTTWAEVTGTAIALADALLEAGRLDDMHRLADFLEAAGEPTAAKDLHTRADAAGKPALERRLSRIHANMTESEIAAAIEALRESKDGAAVSFYIRPLVQAISKLLPAHLKEEWKLDFSTGRYHITWQVAPGDVVSDGTDMFFLEGRRYKYPTPFPARVAKLLVTEGSVVTGSVAVASLIRLPDQLAAEFGTQQTDTRQLPARLDALARIFLQIQAENVRLPRTH